MDVEGGGDRKRGRDSDNESERAGGRARKTGRSRSPSPHRRGEQNGGSGRDRRDSRDNMRGHEQNWGGRGRGGFGRGGGGRGGFGLSRGGRMPPDRYGRPPYQQPEALLSYKTFVLNQTDDAPMEEYQRRYDLYRTNFLDKVSNTFFEEHNQKEWFQERYSPLAVLAKQQQLEEWAVSQARLFAEQLTAEPVPFVASASLEPVPPADAVNGASGDGDNKSGRPRGASNASDGAKPKSKGKKKATAAAAAAAASTGAAEGGEGGDGGDSGAGGGGEGGGASSGDGGGDGGNAKPAKPDAPASTVDAKAIPGHERCVFIRRVPPWIPLTVFAKQVDDELRGEGADEAEKAQLALERVAMSDAAKSRNGDYVRACWIVYRSEQVARRGSKRMHRMRLSFTPVSPDGGPQARAWDHSYEIQAFPHRQRGSYVLDASFSTPARIKHDTEQAVRLARALDAAKGLPAVCEGIDLLLEDPVVKAAVAEQRRSTALLDLVLAYLRRVHFVIYYGGAKAIDEGDMLAMKHTIVSRSEPARVTLDAAEADAAAANDDGESSAAAASGADGDVVMGEDGEAPAAMEVGADEEKSAQLAATDDAMVVVGAAAAAALAVEVVTAGAVAASSSSSERRERWGRSAEATRVDAAVKEWMEELEPAAGEGEEARVKQQRLRDLAAQQTAAEEEAIKKWQAKHWAVTAMVRNDMTLVKCVMPVTREGQDVLVPCDKMFTEERFVVKHLRNKHPDELRALRAQVAVPFMRKMFDADKNKPLPPVAMETAVGALQHMVPGMPPPHMGGPPGPPPHMGGMPGMPGMLPPGMMMPGMPPGGPGGPPNFANFVVMDGRGPLPPPPDFRIAAANGRGFGSLGGSSGGRGIMRGGRGGGRFGGRFGPRGAVAAASAGGVGGDGHPAPRQDPRAIASYYDVDAPSDAPLSLDYGNAFPLGPNSGAKKKKEGEAQPPAQEAV